VLEGSGVKKSIVSYVKTIQETMNMLCRKVTFKVRKWLPKSRNSWTCPPNDRKIIIRPANFWNRWSCTSMEDKSWSK